MVVCIEYKSDNHIYFMSVIVNELSKTYQNQLAVDSLSFEAKKGEILGFLGPNGAGKTTTMKMLCCYLSPTSGNAWIDGCSILESPLDVKRTVGYLAEHNPLYNAMYVREFLEYMAKLFFVSNVKSRVREVIELTGLSPEAHKQIHTLSKGYKQRVGLAQAIIHDPSVLILDEPTSGLDVNQLAEIRSLIKELSKDKTVIFSSHIMQEIEVLCDRVIIVSQGKLVANEPIALLAEKIQGNQTIYLEFEEDKIPVNVFYTIPGVQNVSVEKHIVKISSKQGVDLRKEVFQTAVKNNLTILEMRNEQMQFEEIFKTLTHT
jgi:ABC-2 type transport system ATP-binding protein